MYPGTIINWHDQSAILDTVIESVDNSPLYLALSSFDRGPEDLRVVQGKEFYNLYGNKMNFDSHGQPALQAANIINGGGRLLIKRLVAKDATLANVIASAKITTKTSAVKAADDNPAGRTLNEILYGSSEAVSYTEQLDITSSVGTNDGTTSLLVSPALDSGNSYVYKIVESDVALELDTVLGNEWTEWDGSADLELADGTKIAVAEINSNNRKIKKMGVIEVVSKIANPYTESVRPTNGLNYLNIVSEEGSAVGFTKLTPDTALLPDDVYYYALVEDVSYPDPNVAETDMTGWVEWDGVSELELEDETEIIIAEFSVDDDDPEAILYTPIKGCTIAVNTKKEEDTRTSDSVDLIIPTEDKYILGTQTTSVKWETNSVANVKSYNEVMAAAKNMYKEYEPAADTQDDDSIIITKSVLFPLLVIADNGRGVSNKSVKFSPDYNTSKDMDNMFYDINIFDGSTSLELATGSLNPRCVFSNVLYGINEETSDQVIFGSVPGIYDKYVSLMSNLTGYSTEKLYKSDLMFITNNKGTSLYPYISLDPESVDLNSAFGIELKCGSNGEFGDVPFGTQAWINAAVEVLDGTFDDIIWDVDTYKIAAVFDANYPLAVKKAIAEFVTFREDCVYFRDYGLDIASYASIVNFANSIDEKYRNRFILDYYTTYQIYDPETKVRERVTMMYDFSRAMITHFTNGCYRPMAGVANNMILDNAIKGTINFTPRITPSVNQKALLDDLRVNYAIFEENRCVVQSLYTSQEDYTQLSYGNNVLAIQSVIRSIRIACPKQRYTFASGSDFSSYASAVNNVLRGFRSNFAELTFAYQQDKLKASQKIFYASIFFRFNNWAQTEVFDIYALGDN